MKHHNKTRKFGRTAKQRNMMMSSLARSLIKKERIKTTEAKAKELRPIVEKMVTKAGKSSLATRRALSAQLGEDAAVKVIKELAPRYTERPGGYTRIIKAPRRFGDAAKMAYIEFVETEIDK